MKKLLALVLALVMTLSLCTISNAAFTDAKDVDASYEEAVAVLNGMGVFKGYEDGSFKPEGSITRAEVAAIVYRLYTGDVKDKQAGLYAGYGKFDDMAGATWAAGYVGFCANAGFVKGYGNGKFGPSDPVTGYQALAMILRAVGYGKNGEFEGADWELHVAQIAQQLKVLKNVKGVSLKAAASRELVAELLFQVAAYVPTVTYTPAFGYVTADIAKDVKDETLGWKNFNLATSTNGQDNWGRPQYKWYEEKNDNKKVDSKETVYATVKATPVMTFTEATSECDICEELGESKEAVMTSTWTNGLESKTDVVLKATATKKTVGAQGQLVEIYDGMGADKDEYRMVIIDTYLACVDDVDDMTFDKNDHLKDNATIDLEVYGYDYGAEFDLRIESDSANFDYEEDDYVLVYVNEKDKGNSEILGVAESIEGKQTAVIKNKDQHEVDDKTYDDAAEFNLDEARDDSKLTYTWFFDQYGNIIGDVLVETVYDYAVLKNLTWVSAKAGGYAVADLVFMDGTVKEDVVVDTIDGDEDYCGIEDKDLVDLDELEYPYCDDAEPVLEDTYEYIGFDDDDDVVRVATEGKLNKMFNGYALYRVATLEDGSVKLDVYDYDRNNNDRIGGKLFEIVEEGADGYIDNETGYMGDSSGLVAAATKDTKFIYRTEDSKGNYEYTAYALTDLPEFVDETVVYMVKVNDKNEALYVYILDADELADQHSYFMPTSATVKYTTKTELYTLTGLVDGKESTIDIEYEGLANYLADNVGKLFWIETYNDGTLADAGLVNYAGNPEVATYVAPDAAVTGNFLTSHGKTYYVEKATVLGTKDMTLTDAVKANNDSKLDNNVGIWVVVDQDATHLTAEYIYIGTELSSSTYAEVGYRTAADVETVLKPADFSVVGSTATYSKTLALDETLDSGVNSYIWVTESNKNAVVITDSGDPNMGMDVTLTSGVAKSVKVVAEDGKTEMTYKWTVTNGNTTVLCNDLALEEKTDESWLTVKVDEVEVDVKGYETLTVENLIAALQVDETCSAANGADHSKAVFTVKDNGVAITSGSLKDFVGELDLTIVVTNESENSKTYTLTVKDSTPLEVTEYTLDLNNHHAYPTVVELSAKVDGATVTSGKVEAGKQVTIVVKNSSGEFGATGTLTVINNGVTETVPVSVAANSSFTHTITANGNISVTLN